MSNEIEQIKQQVKQHIDVTFAANPAMVGVMWNGYTSHAQANTIEYWEVIYQSMTGKAPPPRSATTSHVSSRDFTIQNNVLLQYDGNAATVIIPPNVTSIGDSAFDDNETLEKVELPSGLTNIGSYAFSGCVNLKEIVIPSGVTSIDSDAFSKCTSLKKIELPAGLTNIGNDAFSKCTSLEKINLPSGLTSIADDLFNGCTNLREVNIPAAVTSIGSLAFADCVNLASVVIHHGITDIGRRAFDGCDNLTIYIDEEQAKKLDLKKKIGKKTQIADIKLSPIPGR